MKQAEQKNETVNWGQGYKDMLKGQYSYAMNQKDPVHQVRELSYLKKMMAQIDGWVANDKQCAERKISSYSKKLSRAKEVGFWASAPAIVAGAFATGAVFSVVAGSAGLTAVVPAAAAAVTLGATYLGATYAKNYYKDKVKEASERQAEMKKGCADFDNFCTKFTYKINADVDSAIRSMKAEDMMASSSTLQTLCEANATATSDVLKKQFNQKGGQQATKPKAQNAAKAKSGARKNTLTS